MSYTFTRIIVEIISLGYNRKLMISHSVKRSRFSKSSMNSDKDFTMGIWSLKKCTNVQPSEVNHNISSVAIIKSMSAYSLAYRILQIWLAVIFIRKSQKNARRDGSSMKAINESETQHLNGELEWRLLGTLRKII